MLPLLLQACETLKPKSKIVKPQTSQWYYTYSILLTPENPGNSPEMELSMSLYQVKYPAKLADFVYQTLYSSPDLDSYKDRIIKEQRDYYRRSLSYLKDVDSENLRIFDSEGVEITDLETPNWHYIEKIAPISPRYSGIVIQRTKEVYTGGAHGLFTKRYFVLDLDAQKQVKIDDLIDDYQGDKVRELIYDELRKYSKLDKGKPLSSGIYLTDEPELSFNFYVNEEGLGLYWDPYEIAPYSEGSIEIMLPWKKIRPLMLSSGMELLAKFNIYLMV